MRRHPRLPERPARLSSFGRRVAFGAYEAVAEAAVAVARSALLRGAGEAERAERLGAALPRCDPGCLLLHAVSAGEMTAASALASEIERTAPGLKVLLTTGTREGRFVAERLRESCGAVEAVSFLPWDRPGAVRRWLSRLAPSVVVTVEAERLARALPRRAFSRYSGRRCERPAPPGRGAALRAGASLLPARRGGGVVDRGADGGGP